MGRSSKIVVNGFDVITFDYESKAPLPIPVAHPPQHCLHFRISHAMSATNGKTTA